SVITPKTEQAAAPADSEQAARTQQQAIALVTEARAALEAGDLATARAKAEAAQQLQATYPLFSDRPELVLQDLATAQSSTNVASTPAAAAPPMPAHTVTASPEKEQALALIAAARQLLQNKDFTGARAK